MYYMIADFCKISTTQNGFNNHQSFDAKKTSLFPYAAIEKFIDKEKQSS